MSPGRLLVSSTSYCATMLGDQVDNPNRHVARMAGLWRILAVPFRCPTANAPWSKPPAVADRGLTATPDTGPTDTGPNVREHQLRRSTEAKGVRFSVTWM